MIHLHSFHEREIAISITPYQGLKLNDIVGHMNAYYIAISITPYQGLKQNTSMDDARLPQNCNFYYSLLGIETLDGNQTADSTQIAISITPYQGLKQICRKGNRICHALQFLLLPIRD